MDFTFGICTYNSAEYIIQTLESVKYQVVNYGEDVNITLLIADDCSTDNTIELVSEWIKINANLFCECRIIERDKNHGIAYNFSKLLEEIKTEYFKTIDGDDIFSSINVFEQIEGSDDEALTIYIPLRFNEQGVFYKQGECMDAIYYSKVEHSHVHDLRVLETIKPFITPEVCYRRKMYTNETSEFVRQYTQFEDDTSLYQIFKSHKNMKMSFKLEPMILYRIHNTSLSNGVESHGQLHFLDDLHRYKKKVMKEEANLIVKIILFFAIMDTFRMKHRFSTKKSVFKWLVNRLAMRRSNIVKKYSDYSAYMDLLDTYIKNENEHLKLIVNNTGKFLMDINKRI